MHGAYILMQTSEEADSKLNKTAAQLNSTKEQLRQVRDMLNAERSSKEKANTSLANQLEIARRRIGTHLSRVVNHWMFVILQMS